MEKQGEGGEVLFAAALRNSLGGPVSESVTKALLARMFRS